MQQPSLWTSSLAERLRDAGIQAADDHADPEWRDIALLSVHECAEMFSEFTSTSVWNRVSVYEAKTHEGRAMGAVMKRAHKLKWIEPTDKFVNTKRVTRHRAPVRVWKSLVHSGFWRGGE